MNKVLFISVLSCSVLIFGFTQLPPQNAEANGEELYKEHCKSCHMKNGKGFFGMYPPLTDPAWVGNDEKIVENIINGLTGEITVHGKTYDNEMPPMEYLSDAEIAAIVNYVRQEFTEVKATISVVKVKELRGKKE